MTDETICNTIRLKDGTLVDGGKGFIRIEGFDMSHAGLSRILPTQPRCCRNCAFRAGSPERSDAMEWMSLADRFADGNGFLCHEGIPGHEEQVPGQRLHLCAGRAALDRKPIAHLARPAIESCTDPDDRADMLEVLHATQIKECMR